MMSVETAFERACDWGQKTVGWAAMLISFVLFNAFTAMVLAEWMQSRQPVLTMPVTKLVEKPVYVPVLDIPVPTVVERGRNANELAFLRLLNAERVELGLAPLAPHPVLSTGADIRVQDQSERRYYGHYGPQNREMACRVQVASVWKGYAGECCWMCRSPDCGRCDMDDAVAVFKASPGHWTALTGHYEWIGVSIQDLGGIRYFTIEVGNE